MPTCRYHYDALDRLAARTEAAQDTTRHFYQASRLATAIGNTLQRSILATDRQLLAQKDLSAVGERSHLLATDQQDSVLTAASAGQRIEIAYSPYGHRQDSGALPGFTGQESDPLTGHYLLGNGYRAYNPVLGRINSPDSLSPVGEGGLNAYAYCQGDPVNRSDPSGHAADDQIRSFLWIGLGFFGAAWGVKLAVPSIQKVLKGGATVSTKLAAAGAVGQLAASTVFTASRIMAAADSESTVADPLMWGAIALGIPSFGMRISSFYLGKREVRAGKVALARSLEQKKAAHPSWHARLERRIESQSAQLPADTRLNMALDPWRRAVTGQQAFRPDDIGRTTQNIGALIQRQRTSVDLATKQLHNIRQM